MDFIRARKLFPQVKLPKNLLVFADIFFLKVAEELAASSNKHKKTASRVEIFLVLIEMAGKVIDPLSKNCYLYLRRTGVPRMRFKVLNDFLFYILD
jgi:hypothetical protein